MKAAENSPGAPGEQPAKVVARKPRTPRVAKPVPSRALEDELRPQGYKIVAGVDEAGRGPLAGPVVVAACVIPPGVDIPHLNDSKKMTERQREQAYLQLTTDPNIHWALSIIDHEQIDRENILQATLNGMQAALEMLMGFTARQPPTSCPIIAAAQAASEGPACEVQAALVDGSRLPKDLPCSAMNVVDGDATCVCIAAASVIAKVTRDRIMQQYHEQYPQYGWDQNKAYGVPAHLEAIRQHGPCPIHRRSFEPIKSMTGWTKPSTSTSKSKASTSKPSSGRGRSGTGGSAAKSRKGKKGAASSDSSSVVIAGDAVASGAGLAESAGIAQS